MRWDLGREREEEFIVVEIGFDDGKVTVTTFL